MALRAGLAAALTGAMLALVACSDDESGADQDLTATESGSPLADFLGFPPGVFERSDDAGQQTDRQLEISVSECMAAAGFEYVPEIAEPVDARLQADGIDPDSSEWVQKYGFGISTLAFPQAELSGDLIGSSVGSSVAESRDDPALESVSPGQTANEAYLEALSAEEQAAYLDALYGLGLGDADRDANETPGCFDAAVQRIDVATRVDFFVEFADDLVLAYEDIDLHPAVVTYRQDVLACLVEADDTIEADLDALSVIRDRLLIGLANVYELLGDTGFDGSGFDGAGGSGLDGDPASAEEALAELAALQAEELRLAELVDRCDGEPGEEEAAIARARADIERDFIDRNRERLDTFISGRSADE